MRKLGNRSVSPRVCVYLLTFRRSLLLRRAIDSLLKQTFTDWVCKLHNDDPGDRGPRELVDSINDDRIVLVEHETNLGAVRSFNRCWQPIKHEFMSILEDDNWWEPEFLSTMIGIMDEHREVDLAWANMNLWRELPANRWQREGTIWDKSDLEFQVFRDRVPRQMMEPLHSQGAMVVRSTGRHFVPHPDSTPVFMIEALRERIINSPLALCRVPLANFSLTMATARGENLVEKVGGQALLVRDYLERHDVSAEFLREAWRVPWWSGRYALRSMVIGSLFSNRLHLLVVAVRDWEVVLAFLWLVRHPLLCFRIIKYMLQESSISQFLKSI